MKLNKTVSEFKEFIAQGNVMDMAVGVIIGGAFGKIVTSLVNDILMPIVGVLIGGFDFTSLQIQVGTATVKYGNFIQNVVDFLIVAACIFSMLKVLATFKLNKEEEVAEEEPEKDESVLLLEEIRDLLKQKEYCTKNLTILGAFLKDSVCPNH